MRKLFAAIFVVTILITVGLAEGTRSWEQRKFEEFEKGTARGVAIRSDGALELAPSFKAIYTTPSTYIWSIGADAQGNVYAATGAPGRVYRITPQGQATVIFQPQELQVQSLLVDPKGVVYAATSPDGKVYKIERKPATAKEREDSKSTTNDTKARGGKAANSTDDKSAQEDRSQVPVDPNYSSSVYFDPQSKYIWDLAQDQQGRLYVATGDRGEIFKVEPDGKGSLFFKSDEAHIRALALDNKGNLIAGSDGSGLVYRISPAGEAFVLYSAPKKEITALAIDGQGNIYAAGVGEKTPRSGTGQPSQSFSMPSPVLNVNPAAAAALSQGGPQPQAVNIPMIPFPATGATGGSEVYQIAPDGSPQKIWSSREEVVYALSFDPQGHLLAASGNHGKIFAINGVDEFTDLVKASATQVTALAKSPTGGVYAATSNLGKVFLLGGSADAQGEYESDVFDAKIFSRWGRAEVRGRGAFDLFARSGNVDNPDRNWSPWRKIDFAKGGELDVPPARFVQWKAVLKAGNPTAVIDSVLVNYLPKNVAPVVDDVIVQTGARFNPMPRPTIESVSVGGTSSPRFDSPVPAVKDRNSIAVRWTAHDDNDDDLTYSLYYRGDSETEWKLLKGDLDEKYYSFDASLLPDGGYTFKVVASDAPSHSPEDALSSSKESTRFEIDTTPPQVQNLNATVDNNALHITFRALDGFSPIKRAEYSIDAGDWQYVEPVGGLSDYRVENYDFSVPMPASKSDAGTGTDGVARRAAVVAPGEHVVVVRVYDRYDNLGSAKYVIRGH